MNPTPATRRDPMTEVMPYELLDVAHQLMVRRQNRAYWEAVPEPKNPVGQVRFEVARQVATFAVPLAALVIASVLFGLKGLLAGIPAAWLMGYLLDKQLQMAIRKRAHRDAEIDAGRYEAVKWLSNKMGIPRSEITLPVIYKMAEDFRVEDTKRKEAEAARQAAEEAAGRRHNSRRKSRGDTDSGQSAGRRTTGNSNDSDDGRDYYNSGIGNTSVNPASGLPMLGGGAMLDVGGNTFGFNDM